MNEIKTNEERLRSEIEDLKRRLAAGQSHGPAVERKGPTFRTFAVLISLVLALVVAGYFLGYLPRQQREMALAQESKAGGEALPVVNVAPVERSLAKGNLVLAGNIQAVTEAPVMARSSGYVLKRYVDIGDRVQEGQVLAEIEAPELDQQIAQAKATVDQARSNIEQTQAALEQGRSNAALAKVTADRQQKLFDKDVISRQDNDTAQMQYAAQQANVQALEKAVAAARGSASAVEANLARLNDLKNYLTVRAPFAGVITVRNIDVGALVNEGSTLLYRIAQTGRLRTYLNVPQADAGNVRVGQHATLEIAGRTGVKVPGEVTRTANSLDPATRTLLVEVQVANAAGTLMPGMYAQVDLSVPRLDPPLLIPGDTLVVRSDGPQVAVVGPDGVVHFTRIQLGRDFGHHLEVLAGLQLGQQLVANPSDVVREGAKVKPVQAPQPAAVKR
ncbi:MAG: efflux RND transporter periplasmic adaptor subunit [Bryobacteraceae bacterium]|jgi:RND family efflux transporter MFP subunit